MARKTILQSLLSLTLLLNLVAVAGAQSEHQGVVRRSFTEPIKTSLVATSEIGVVLQSQVTEGDKVKAGDPLAVLNHGVLLQSRKIAIARSESTAVLEAARATAAMLKAQKETLESLVPGGHVNQYELDLKVTEFENAIADVRAAEDDIRLNRLEVDRIDAELKRRTISSPIDGFVTKIHRQLGEHLSTSQPEYATVVQIDLLKVRFYLDEKTTANLKKGDKVNVLVGPERSPRTAKVSFVSPIIDPDSGTGRIEVVIDNRDFEIRSGIVCYWSQNQRTPKKTTVASAANANKLQPLSPPRQGRR